MKFKILTFGCQMNVYDTERMERYLIAAGHEPALTEDLADILVINTCSIRDTAESRVYGTLGRLAHFKKENPNRMLVVAGCMAQKEGKRLHQRAPHIDVIAGTYAIPRLPTLLENVSMGLGVQIDTRRTEDTLFDPTKLFESSHPTEHTYPVFVSIMQGCSKVCSYCVVPSTRGKEICRPMEQVFKECLMLVQRGYREVTLIGQNVDSYRYGSKDFADLLVSISRIEGLERIRFTTSHPQDITPKLIDTVAQLPKVCETFHFPLQAGSNRVLKEMKRGYTVEEYFEKLAYIEKTFGSRHKIPFSYCISTDLMVGFANETEREFEETLEACRQAQWDSAFMFKYSKREGTAAWFKEDLISDEEKSERLARLIELQESISLEINKITLDSVAEVMVEALPNSDPDNPVDIIKCRTRTNKVVVVVPPVDSVSWPAVGDIIKVRITDCKPITLRGTLIQTEQATQEDQYRDESLTKHLPVTTG